MSVKNLDCWLKNWVVVKIMDSEQKLESELKNYIVSQEIGLFVQILDNGLKNWIVGQNFGFWAEKIELWT